ncbi:hypothetical protein, partial [Nonomuraea zeae]|uniref:hypothetical protein n=1 Tax=Nonomuraea zeae TaxID=1642303 RepID=UPI0019801F34
MGGENGAGSLLTCEDSVFDMTGMVGGGFGRRPVQLTGQRGPLVERMPEQAVVRQVLRPGGEVHRSALQSCTCKASGWAASWPNSRASWVVTTVVKPRPTAVAGAVSYTPL